MFDRQNYYIGFIGTFILFGTQAFAQDLYCTDFLNSITDKPFFLDVNDHRQARDIPSKAVAANASNPLPRAGQEAGKSRNEQPVGENKYEVYKTQMSSEPKLLNGLPSYQISTAETVKVSAQPYFQSSSAPDSNSEARFKVGLIYSGTLASADLLLNEKTEKQRKMTFDFKVTLLTEGNQNFHVCRPESVTVEYGDIKISANQAECENTLKNQPSSTKDRLLADACRALASALKNSRAYAIGGPNPPSDGVKAGSTR